MALKKGPNFQKNTATKPKKVVKKPVKKAAKKPAAKKAWTSSRYKKPCKNGWRGNKCRAKRLARDNKSKAHNSPA